MEDDKMPYIEVQTTHDSSTHLVERKGPVMQTCNSQGFLVVLTFACEALMACAKQLDLIDEECGDGNYGSILAQSANAIKVAIKGNRILATRPSTALTQISRIIEKESGGLEGRIYSLFFDTAAKSFLEFRDDEQLTADMWLTVLTSANNMISEVSRALVGDRSMLAALIPMEHRLRDALNSGLNPVNAFGEAIKAAETAATQTIHMPAHYVSSTNPKTLKYPDPGAHAVGIWMRAAYEGFKLKFSCQYDV